MTNKRAQSLSSRLWDSNIILFAVKMVRLRGKNREILLFRQRGKFDEIFVRVFVEHKATIGFYDGNNLKRK